jgi:hypothetical protein
LLSAGVGIDGEGDERGGRGADVERGDRTLDDRVLVVEIAADAVYAPAGSSGGIRRTADSVTAKPGGPAW